METITHPACLIDEADHGRALDILQKEWHECGQCGSYVRNDDTTSICNPRAIREHRAYLRQKARIASIRARMEAREMRFKQAQAQDEMLLWHIQRDGR
jgi:hypothetical protein